MATNYDALQTPRDPTTKHSVRLGGVKTRYLAMGSWHALGGSGGALSVRKRKQMRSTA